MKAEMWDGNERTTICNIFSQFANGNPFFPVHSAETPTRITGDSNKNRREVNSTPRDTGIDVDLSGKDNHSSDNQQNKVITEFCLTCPTIAAHNCSLTDISY